MSYNPVTEKFESKAIVSWFDNGEADKFLWFKVDAGKDKGVVEFGVTHNHLLMDTSGALWPAATFRAGATLKSYHSKDV